MNRPFHTIHDDRAIEQWRRALRLDPHPLQRMRYAFYQQSRSAAEVLEELPREVRGAWQEQFAFHVLALDQRSDSPDGATKLVFQTASRARLEAVILRARTTRRTTLCVSSQSGCAARCVFCATGQMPRVVNLSAAEIVDQVLQANRLLLPEGRRIQNVVFMGMGEPLHNEPQVFQAAELLFSRRHCNLSARRTILSSVGIPEGMLRWARRFPRSPVALSLHAARPELRAQLIPLARQYPLPALRQAVAEVARLQRQPVMIEYLLLEGVNNGPEDLAALTEFLSGLPVLVNLIPMNRVSHAPQLRAPDQRSGNAFAAHLRQAGFTVTFRYSLGNEVAAACGQLAGIEEPAVTNAGDLHTLT